MSIVRIYVNDLNAQSEVIITDKYHYIVNVMKCKIGDEITLVNGNGKEYKGNILTLKKNSLIINNIKCVRKNYKNNFIGLIFPPIHKIDILVKLATELNTTDFFPFKSKYTQVKYNDKRIFYNIVEALEQSERLVMPNIYRQYTLKEILDNYANDGYVLFGEERKEYVTNIVEIMHNIDINCGFSRQKLYALIGPEGGFSEDEKNLIKSYKNVIGLSLSHNILRTETAVASILTIINQLQII